MTNREQQVLTRSVKLNTNNPIVCLETTATVGSGNKYHFLMSKYVN